MKRLLESHANKMEKSVQINILNRVPFIDVLLFTKHLSVMVRAGIPITDALSALIDQAKSKSFRKIISEILADIVNGKKLADALKKHGRVFDHFYVSLIEVGEESGTLEESLSFLTDQLSRQYNLTQKVKSATMYPAVIVGVTLAIGGFISFFILPKLTDFFSSFDIPLPPATKALLLFANLMRNYGAYMVVCAIFLPVIFYFSIQVKSVKKLWHEILLKMPVFGDIVAYGELSRFSRNLGILLKNGVDVTKSIEVTSITLSNLKFSDDLMKVSKSLSEGKNIGTTLKSFKEFPPTVYKMISIGEKSGQLDEVLMFLGDFYDEEIDNISKNLTTILEPILLLVIGTVVGFVALAIISPIYELTGQIAG